MPSLMECLPHLEKKLILLKKTPPLPLKNEVPFQEKVGSYSSKTSVLTWSIQNFKEH